MGEHHAMETAGGGLAASAGGYALETAWEPSEGDLEGRLDFRVVDRGGGVVTAFDEQHGKRMHLIIVRRDLSHYQHLHLRWARPGLGPHPWSSRNRASTASSPTSR
jgi:hypothetical protein